MDNFDVIIIGSGIIGSLIAYQLSPYQLKVLVIDKNVEVGDGVTKANSAIIHAGYDPEPGTLKSRLNARGNELYTGLSNNLGFDFKRVGSYVLASTIEEENTLRILQRRAHDNGVDVSLLTGDEVRRREPNVAAGVTLGLYAPTTGILAPWDVVYAALNHSVHWGTSLALGEKIVSITRTPDGFHVTSEKNIFCGKVLINAAGHGAISLHEMMGLKSSYQVTPTRGQYYVIDRGYDTFASSVLFPTPSSQGKGVLVVPTIHGNFLLGPTSEVVASEDDKGITIDGVTSIKQQLKRIVTNVPYQAIIRSFAGIRPKINGGDFVIEESTKLPGYIYLFGIDSPGLASAPAIAEYVVSLLPPTMLSIKHPNFIYVKRKLIPISKLAPDEANKLIVQNSSYGRIVCRCEQISEGEIIDAIKEPIGAVTVDGVKRRVRPGSGRCQGGFCQPIVLAILANELKVSKDKVLLDKAGSNIVIEPLFGGDNDE